MWLLIDDFVLGLILYIMKAMATARKMDVTVSTCTWNELISYLKHSVYEILQSFGHTVEIGRYLLISINFLESLTLY